MKKSESKSAYAYAAVVKMFKHKDNRIQANAIEAAMSIDRTSTPLFKLIILSIYFISILSSIILFLLTL